MAAPKQGSPLLPSQTAEPRHHARAMLKPPVPASWEGWGGPRQPPSCSCASGTACPPPPGTSAPGSHLAPLLFWEDLAISAGISGTARVPALSAPTGSGKEPSLRPKRGPASVGCQRVGIP